VDNDMAFGTRPVDLDHDELAYSARLPKVIDQSTFDALIELKPEDIDTACAGLPAAQIEATKVRLDYIQKKILKFDKPEYPNEGRVLPDDSPEWSSPNVSELLGVRPFDLDGPIDAVAAAVRYARRTSYVANASAILRAAHLYEPPKPVYDPAEFATFVRGNGAVAA
jgi:hypothetical protein